MSIQETFRSGKPGQRRVTTSATGFRTRIRVYGQEVFSSQDLQKLSRTLISHSYAFRADILEYPGGLPAFPEERTGRIKPGRMVSRYLVRKIRGQSSTRPPLPRKGLRRVVRIKKLTGQGVMYSMVGVINTLVVAGVIGLLMWLDVYLYAANACGYAAGICCSYVLNSKYTFKKSINRHRMLKFCTVVGISYLMNLVTIFIFLQHSPESIYLSQVTGSLIYSTIGFTLNKSWSLK